MGRTTTEKRRVWRALECAESEMVTLDFGPDRIRVAPPTVDAWKALAQVLRAHAYEIRVPDTDSYNCRTITGGTGKSLHSYGIALDVNWRTNPFRRNRGDVRFSTKPTQAGRALDVKHDLADTDMTAAMIADVRAIQTRSGDVVFEWGGDWRSVKDAMHFELDRSPDELAAGIDWSTVASGEPTAPSPIPEVLGMAERVIARSGLNLRGGPGIEFGVIRTLAFGTVVGVIGRNGPWALVDTEGDGAADGHVHSAFLTSV